MYCKILTDVTKTIADVLQDLNRSHKDNRHKSINENVLPVLNGSHEVIRRHKIPPMSMQDPYSYKHLTGVFKQFGK